MSSFTIRDIFIDPFDGASVERAIGQIKEIEGRLQPAIERLVKQLAEKGVEIAKAELLFFDKPAYDTGALSDSIKCEVNGDKGIISAGEGLTNAMGVPTNYALFVEYGNGSSRPNGWWYPDPAGNRTVNGQSYSFTLGMSPRPFMHNTYEDLIDEAKAAGGKIVAEYLA